MKLFAIRSILINVLSHSAAPNRLECSVIPLGPLGRSLDADDDVNETIEPSAKRTKFSSGRATRESGVEIGTMSIFNEVDYFAKRLRSTWEASHV